MRNLSESNKKNEESVETSEIGAMKCLDPCSEENRKWFQIKNSNLYLPCITNGKRNHIRV